MIDAWPNWPGHLVVLAGPIGSGKTHIASVWAGETGAICTSAADFENCENDLIAAAGNGKNILIEDMGSDFANEKGLFHLLNTVREAGSYCMITSRTWPREWDISLPDLRSRLTAAQLVELQEPDDELLRQVMIKLFADRQLSVETGVVDYCVLRMERSLESASRLVGKIDRMALAEKKTISKKIAGAALSELGMS